MIPYASQAYILPRGGRAEAVGSKSSVGTAKVYSMVTAYRQGWEISPVYGTD
jgi:hypothetical protein